ncbi:MAG: hypothetical protein QN141_02930 [Armatimonadota bacterium]|nr:hypothetical protein [Armatimonadota bacterium]MDR7452091.1 hypothetical protein [Armatimonadota bacterium]MDR7466553.1 hypothetical protein [Armatimonadota bacterium]MDR7493275.1 hypothetical protein [Armatimonadota bacterium]MDR7499832.1 hypothetical protein [Armatimonadota bacterium]
MQNRFVSEMLGRQRLAEMYQAAERERLVRSVEPREEQRPLWKRVLTWVRGGPEVVVVAPGEPR